MFSLWYRFWISDDFTPPHYPYGERVMRDSHHGIATPRSDLDRAEVQSRPKPESPDK